MGQTQHVEVTPKQIQRANDTWHAFVKMGKWSIIASCVILIMLGLVFIDW